MLISRNMRLVAHVIKKYQNSGYETEDLLSVGHHRPHKGGGFL